MTTPSKLGITVVAVLTITFSLLATSYFWFFFFMIPSELWMYLTIAGIAGLAVIFLYVTTQLKSSETTTTTRTE